MAARRLPYQLCRRWTVPVEMQVPRSRPRPAPPLSPADSAYHKKIKDSKTCSIYVHTLFLISAHISQVSMLDCPGCLQRCFRAVVYRSKPLNASRRQSSVFTPSGDQLHRFRPHSTAVEPSQERGFITARQQARRVSKERWYPPQEENARILAHKHRAHGPKDTTFSPDIQPSRSDLGERQLQSELAYLKDPLKLSDRIWNLLHQDDSEKAIALARMASSKLPCVVSWNHIIDWHMSKGKVNTAMKIYNEVGSDARHFGRDDL